MGGKLEVSVRGLVEFVLRTGDIDTRYAASERMQDGSRAHRRVQKASPGDYTPEVTLSHAFSCGGFEITLSGRADGVIREAGGVTVDEIKSTLVPLKDIPENWNPLHWAQARCYACMLALEQQLPRVGVQLTYCEPDGPGLKSFRRSYTADELLAFVQGLFERYLIWAEYETDRKARRDAAIRAQAFPFGGYRRGQRELAAAVYRAAAGRAEVFAQAPTGIGKTISTLFPAVKAIGEGKAQKIFYLTAKTITRQVALDAMRSMEELVPSFKTVALTAKDKICPHPEARCTPDQCPLAKGYYDRLGDALYTLLNRESLITREVVEAYARDRSLCPFELSLDLTAWADCIICDYNYVFDPIVSLRQYFSGPGGDYLLLTDEAHNLVDRAREMFSAELCKAPFLAVQKSFAKRAKPVASAARKVNSCFVVLRKRCEELPEGVAVQKEDEPELARSVEGFVRRTQKWLAENPEAGELDELLELYFSCLSFLRISLFYDENYITFLRARGKEVSLRLFCLDPAPQLAEILRKTAGAVFFSATLSPLSYYRDVLGGGEEARLLRLPSPYAAENLCLLVADGVSTLYQNRAASRSDVAALIKALADGKTGNYIAYFPSYQYMNEVYSAFTQAYPQVRTALQQPNLSEPGREEFLLRFGEDAQETLVGFCVLGGVFSEGVDLKGGRLIGAAVVGVGLPKLGPEQDVIRSYFDEKNGMGFRYAYQYPGMNKVLQAAGRVIRSETDRGAVLLIDDRFTRRDYRGLFPPHWSHFRRVRGPEEAGRALAAFWEGAGV